MEAIRKITTVNDGVISFDDLNKYNHQKVEVIILPLFSQATKSLKSKKENLMQYDGMIESNTKDTSNKVDELIYGK